MQHFTTTSGYQVIEKHPSERHRNAHENPKHWPNHSDFVRESKKHLYKNKFNLEAYPKLKCGYVFRF